MSEIKTTQKKNSFSADWLVRGILTKLGDTFDKLTGRGWKPSSSLATSELIEKLKALMDLEVKDLGEKGRFVPHNFKLKMQWDKFSTDSETTLVTLQNELLTAAIDHINDHRYHTYAPFNIEVKPDYFTEGVQLFASFDKFGNAEDEVAVNVTVPGMNVSQLVETANKPIINEEKFIANFVINEIEKNINLQLKTGSRLSVGRSRENDLSIEDSSVSKIHASLVLNNENQLLVADTGSTNGTFINNERIAYGKAFPIENNKKVKFGSIEVTFNFVPKPIQIEPEIEQKESNSVTIGDFEFKSRNDLEVAIPTTSDAIEVNQVYETRQKISFEFEKKENTN